MQTQGGDTVINDVTDNRSAVAAAHHTGASHLLTEGLERPLLSRQSFGL